MPIPNQPQEEVVLHRAPQPDPGISFRVTAASFGLVLIGVGTLMAGYLFLQLARVLLDPRPLVEQVNRWEFVIRGRTNDVPVRPVERGEAERVRPQQSHTSANDEKADALTPASESASPREIEIAAQYAKRLGSLGARPVALLLMLIVLGIMVRIAIAFIESGGKLVSMAAGEKEFMQKLLKEITGRRT